MCIHLCVCGGGDNCGCRSLCLRPCPPFSSFVNSIYEEVRGPGIQLGVPGFEERAFHSPSHCTGPVPTFTGLTLTTEARLAGREPQPCSCPCLPVLGSQECSITPIFMDAGSWGVLGVVLTAWPPQPASLLFILDLTGLLVENFTHLG